MHAPCYLIVLKYKTSINFKMCIGVFKFFQKNEQKQVDLSCHSHLKLTDL